jgi:hypothetical protein
MPSLMPPDTDEQGRQITVGSPTPVILAAGVLKLPSVAGGV